ncbi:MAG: efflux RND transporter periplasmic adaptor subunit [Pseudomonadota bacterium]
MSSICRGTGRHLDRIHRCVAALMLGLSPVSMTVAQEATTVNVATLADVQVAQRQFAPADVIAANRAIVAAEVAANIDSVAAEVGQRVKKGDVLAQLDQRDYQLALEQAEAQLASTNAQIDQANLRLKRAQKLSGNQYISADDLLARETDVVVLTANRAANNVAIRIAKNNLDKTQIRAPFDSVVVARPAQVGSYVTPAAPMFELVQLDSAEVEARVASNLVAGIESATALRFERNGEFWPVRLLRVSPVVASESGAQIVRLAFAQQAAAVGSSGRFSWQDAGGLVPTDLLVKRNGELGVFIAEGDRARFYAVAGAQEGRPAAVGLDPSTTIVTVGRFKLQDGQLLNIVGQ